MLRFASAVPTLAVVALAGQALAQTPLVGVAFRDPSFSGPTRLYDINQFTGAASNPRVLGTDAISGIALSPDGTLYGWTDEFATVNGTPVDGALVTIDPATGATSLVGNVSPFPSGALASEGDIDFNPTSGELFGVTSNNGVSLLFTIDPSTAANTEIGILQRPGTDISGLSFSPDGTLWALDTGTDFNPATRESTLLRLDPVTAAIIEVVPLDIALGTVAGMDFDPDTGVLVVADGDFLGNNQLYTVDIGTGAVAPLGPLGLDGAPTGFGGLSDIEFIPAPGSAAVLAASALVGLRRRRA